MRKILFYALVMAFCFSAASFGAAAYNPHEPKVSAEEAELLKKVRELFSEDKPGEALNLLLPAIEKESSAALDFAAGTLHYRLENQKEAEKAFRAALEKFPAFSRARSNLASMYLQDGRTDEAFGELKTVMLEGTADAQELTMTGYIYLLRDEAVAAEGAYRQAITREAADMNAYTGLAKSLILQARYDEVISLMNSMLEKEPLRGEFWVLLGNAYAEEQKFTDAAAALEAARRLKKADAHALGTLGDLYMNQDMPADALKAYEESFALSEPSFERLTRIVSAFLSMGRTEEAVPFLAKARSLLEREGGKSSQKDREKILWLEARHAQLSGNAGKAREGYRKVLELNPLHGDALISAGDLYREDGLLEEALIYYERAGRAKVKEVDSLLRQAQIYISREQFPKAVEMLEHAQSLAPQAHVGRYLEQVRRLAR